MKIFKENIKKTVLKIKRGGLFFPRMYFFFQKIEDLFLNRSKAKFPQIYGDELTNVAEVLVSSGWNMNYGKGLMHERLEQAFADYIGCKYAIAVSSGGMGIQVGLRALGLLPGDQVIHQVDTCIANSFSILNAAAVPVFADSSECTFMLDFEKIKEALSEKTKVLMPIHMWGNSENMDNALDVASKHNLYLFEDSCLSLGATWKGRKTGTFGHLSVFSMGCLKPLQAGEGGILTTNDEALAKELRMIRSYGEMEQEYGIRDQKTLSWNGRMSEIVAAVALAQLKGYPNMLERLRNNVMVFKNKIKDIDGITMIDVSEENSLSAYNSIILSLNIETLKITKPEILEKLRTNGISCWNANFELITDLSFFKKGEWQNWQKKSDNLFIEKNYAKKYDGANNIYKNIGISINKIHFFNHNSTIEVVKALKKVIF